MKPSVKAALLSALIFPGVGQISLGHKKRGWLIIGFIAVIFYFIINEIMNLAYTVIEDMQKKGATMDVENISNATSGLVGFSDNMFLNFLLIVLLVTWVLSIFDAYRLDKKIS